MSLNSVTICQGEYEGHYYSKAWIDSLSILVPLGNSPSSQAPLHYEIFSVCVERILVDQR